jgi:hypothetical protein
MVEDGGEAPIGVDVHTPSIARMYDYYLGGKDNFPADRAAADTLLAVAPEIATIARENRAFLGRAVRYLAGEAGIRQFLDIGTGLPTRNNVHHVAQEQAPDSRIVYVDNDAVVLAHARALLATDPRTVVVHADLLGEQPVTDLPEVRAHLDFDRPIALLLVAILHFISDDDRPFEVVARLRDALPPGSYLAVSHVVYEHNPEAIEQAEEVYRGFLHRSGQARRTREDVLGFFDGCGLVDPGLTYVTQWRPDRLVRPGAERVWIVGGVARTP